MPVTRNAVFPGGDLAEGSESGSPVKNTPKHLTRTAEFVTFVTDFTRKEI